MRFYGHFLEIFFRNVKYTITLVQILKILGLCMHLSHTRHYERHKPYHLMMIGNWPYMIDLYINICNNIKELLNAVLALTHSLWDCLYSTHIVHYILRWMININECRSSMGSNLNICKRRIYFWRHQKQIFCWRVNQKKGNRFNYTTHLINKNTKWMSHRHYIFLFEFDGKT